MDKQHTHFTRQKTRARVQTQTKKIQEPELFIQAKSGEEQLQDQTAQLFVLQTKSQE